MSPGTGTMGAGTGTMGAGTVTGPGAYILQAMPAGRVSFGHDAAGHLQAHVDVFGLTPGSAHDVAVDGAGSGSGPAVQFPALTADAGGQADTILTAAGSDGPPPGGRFVISLGSGSAGDPAAAAPIAETGLLTDGDASAGGFSLHAVTATADGTLQRPSGQATVTFDAVARTLTVTLTAHGLNPGPHAAHIHLGSCQRQGPVAFMMPDFTADSAGNIIGQTRVITGVSSVPGPGTWYINLHQGGMADILANGAPTLAFRPLLCAGLTSFATATTPPPVTAAPTATVPPMAPMAPAASPSMPMMPTSPSPSSAPATPQPGPTHF